MTPLRQRMLDVMAARVLDAGIDALAAAVTQHIAALPPRASWNLSAMHVVAAKEMKRNGIPMDKLIVVSWFNEVDIANIGLAMYSAMFEGTRLAIKQGGWPLTPAKIKAGLESLKDFDVNDLLAPVTVTAKDHGGGGETRIDMWDGTKWVPQSGWIAAYGDVVDAVVKEQSAEFAKTAK